MHMNIEGFKSQIAGIWGIVSAANTAGCDKDVCRQPQLVADCGAGGRCGSRVSPARPIPRIRDTSYSANFLPSYIQILWRLVKFRYELVNQMHWCFRRNCTVDCETVSEIFRLGLFFVLYILMRRKLSRGTTGLSNEMYRISTARTWLFAYL